MFFTCFWAVYATMAAHVRLARSASELSTAKARQRREARLSNRSTQAPASSNKYCGGDIVCDPPRILAGGGGREGSARSSKFRGVTKHRRSGRFEAHIWVKELGRQVYLGKWA